MKSKLEEAFAETLLQHKLPTSITQYRFASPRRWSFDFAWPDMRIVVEIEGGTWVNGRHSTGIGFGKDCEKYNAATLMGWRVFRFTTNHLKTLYPIQLLKSCLMPSDKEQPIAL